MGLLENFQISEWLTPSTVSIAIRFILTLLIGYPLIKALTKIFVRLLSRHLTPQSEMIVKRIIWYTLLTVLWVSALNQLGFKLSALLGAAGIFGVAIGFASQTSFSNLISGLFMITEKSFVVGDTIQIGSTVGVVLSIDLLSVKLKTFDNRFIRIPNENLIKAELINISRYPIRRTDFEIGISGKSDMQKAQDIVREVISQNELALKDPAPYVAISAFSDTEVILKVGIWANKENVYKCGAQMKIELYERLKKEGVVVPIPPRIYAMTDEDRWFFSQLIAKKNSIEES
ncbi:MAG: mechanosensitive ion channel family protein [Candidatus Cloacimonadales bacterium]|jgi:small-conductance mechanosensitive channel|nr:mechanosensitive ion channel family protein [Candidatus Cloacimonadota bacterium]MDD2649931.1 mechanosensitive ion channel family protein [Candidatus Cloacimonadota bacterium]MDD3501798.1 mechanosensitive ion channel family protein [Candidatus Cloacimonadota bacterium]MDX9976489.1 mechanosensitive ion channel family protein [Candidatus Cloacimonadales bacterium]